MTDPYAYWKAAIAGEKPKPIVDQCECGFYRKPISERQPNGRNKRIGWTPVAVFMDRDTMTARVGSAEDGRDITGDALGELWSWIADQAITEEVWRAVAERGEPWPDDHKSRKPQIVEDRGGTGANETVTVEGRGSGAPDVFEEPPETKIAREIAEQRKYLDDFKTIESDEQSARARSLQNEFLALKKAAADEYERANRPLLDAQKALRETWFPLRDEAEGAANGLRTIMGGWEDSKRAAARLAQEAADRAAREHAEAIRKAQAANAPAPPPLEPVKPNTPPPSTQIVGGTGRAASVRVEKFVTTIDAAKVFPMFAGNAEVIALLTKLAQAAVRAGVDVPGAVVEERSVVR